MPEECPCNCWRATSALKIPVELLRPQTQFKGKIPIGKRLMGGNVLWSAPSKPVLEASESGICVCLCLFPLKLFVQTVLPLSYKLSRRHAERVWANFCASCFQLGLLGWGGFWVFFFPWPMPLTQYSKTKPSRSITNVIELIMSGGMTLCLENCRSIRSNTTPSQVRSTSTC